MQITDETPLNAKVTKSEIAKYFNLEDDTGSIKHGFFIAINNTTQCIRMSFCEQKIFHTFVEDPVYINCEPFIYNYDILEYFGFPFREIDSTNTYDFRVYGEVKRIIQPLIRIIEEYHTTDIIEILFKKLLHTENLVRTLTTGSCLFDKIPNELILDVIKKKDEL